MLVKAGSDGIGNGAGAPSLSADVGQRAGNVAAPEVVFVAVGAIRPEHHVGRVDAAGEIALVAQHGIVGVGPPQPWDHPVFELVGEQMRRDGTAAGRSGQTGSAERPVPGRGHPGQPGGAEISGPEEAFGFEPGDDSRIVEPGPPQVFGDPDRLRLPDQRHLERGRCRERGSCRGRSLVTAESYSQVS